MDFRFTPEETAFRQEMRAFLRQELPHDWVGLEDEDSDEAFAFTRAMTRKLAQRGWLCMAWPKAYGGQGASYFMQLIFGEEMGYHRAPGQDQFGVHMVGPTIIVHGTEEQKRRHLPGITSGEVYWCQGFSEPGAGSDLASLQCRAVEEGDDYVINGQKIWTSNGHHADWMFVITRTDPQAPKHRGISYFLLNKKTPGIEVRPLVNMANLHSFNEVFFDNVRVPKENMVGERNMGWYVAATTLDFERSGSGNVAAARRTLEDLVHYAQETKVMGHPLAADPLVRHRLAEAAVEIEAGRMLAYRIAWIQSQGQIPYAEASMVKAYTSELDQRLAQLGMQLMGLYGQLEPGSKWAPLKGRLERIYLVAVSRTIAAGTSEIQRNIIAMRGLGLPRSY